MREVLLPDGAPGRQPGRELERRLREAIRSGRLRAGERLPSSRDLAGQFGIARGTAVAVYRQLGAEGYVVSQHGSGTKVADSVAEPAVPAETGPARSWRYGLGPGLPSLAAFPRSAWLAALRKGLADLDDVELGYPDPAGLLPLRTELAGYLGRVRAVVAEPSDLVITHGTFDALTLLAGALQAQGHREIGLEDPGSQEQYELFANRGLTGRPIPVDDEGIRVDVLTRSSCRAVLITPAHQYPLGVSLSPDRRRALLQWARSTDSLVIEDDYDAEYRYDRAPVGALQSMDPDHVAYLGTLSKTLAPALRLGWMVPPARLLTDLVRRKRLDDRGCGSVEQAALTRFLSSGSYDRHLRRTRLLYRDRRDALLEALAADLPDWRPIGIAAGLHVVLQLPPGTDDRALTARLADHDIRVAALSRYTHTGPATPGLVLGYAGLTPDRLRSAVRAIAVQAGG
ncbi:PLP-dependent aminotransferase family protein [Kribbella sandramycini]